MHSPIDTWFVLIGIGIGIGVLAIIALLSIVLAAFFVYRSSSNRRLDDKQ